MQVFRLHVAQHALLRELAAYADQLEAPAPPYRERGDLLADIAGGPPAADRTRPEAFRFAIMEWEQPLWMPIDSTLASVNYYPPGGSGLGWHSDTSRPGWRVYIGRPLEGVPGEFLVEGGAYSDVAGVAHAFYVSGVPGESWHALRAGGARFSVGIRIDGEVTARALGLGGESATSSVAGHRGGWSHAPDVVKDGSAVGIVAADHAECVGARGARIEGPVHRVRERAAAFTDQRRAGRADVKIGVAIIGLRQAVADA